ncbi:MAG: hypothetical protein ABJK20_10200 [Halieaceae bacterium]
MLVLKKAWIAMVLLLAPLSPAVGDDIGDAALALCEKVKACSMAQIDQEDLTPELRQMMEPMLENMCTNMQARVQEVPVGHELYQPSVACMRSMEALSCEAMMDSEQFATPECKDYEQKVRDAAGQ